MTTIKATCPVCGDVDLTPADLTLVVAERLGWSAYHFTCTSCVTVVRKPADDEVVALLTQAGVRLERLDVPQEYLEALEQFPEARAITEDEVLDFALWLGSQDDIVTALVEDG
jgi:hypothetical protein